MIGSPPTQIPTVTAKGAHRDLPRIGALRDPVTWYGINYAGTQVTQWDFQKQRKAGLDWYEFLCFGQVHRTNQHGNSVLMYRQILRAYFKRIVW